MKVVRYRAFVTNLTPDQWKNMFQMYPGDKYKGAASQKKFEKIDWSKVPIDALYCHDKFDALLWWSKEGMKNYPHCAVGASLVLSKPATNACQERVFSKCQWMQVPMDGHPS